MKRKGADRYWVYLTKTNPYNDENAIDFRLSDEKEEDEEDIALANWLRACKSKLIRKIF